VLTAALLCAAVLQGGDSLVGPGWHGGSSSSGSGRHVFGGGSADPLSHSPLARLFGGLVAGLAGDLQVGGRGVACDV
jgi:hypothetical protein